ncbi:MAG TPA: efflux RND transporter periplasmic adaptor subunit [Bryobacteraceae bacterium]|nr:efflux RND transporter periplasmic adaptor subunit [Bryobacteraceae bacterium]
MKKLWPVLLVVALLLVLWWLVDRKESTPTVHFAEVKRETIASTIPTNGKVEPLQFAAARAEIAGVVQKIAIERGQDVKAGQTLVVLDNSTERAAYDSATAQVQQAKANASIVEQGGKAAELSQSESDLRNAQLALQEAQRNLASAQRLYKQQAATHQEVLSAQDSVQRARLKVDAVKGQRKTLVSAEDRSISESKLNDSRAALELARHRLDLTTIKAPMSGTIYQFDLKLGAYLNLGDLVAMIGDLDKVRVRVYVDEPELGRVAENLPVEITWQARPGRKWSGSVTQMPTEIVALQTRQVGVVTCIIDNPQHELLPGTNVDVVIVSSVVNNAVSIPKQALQSTAEGSGVFKLLNGDRLKWQAVTTGVSNVTSIEIKSGLQPGDRVALPSDVALADGMNVKVVAD